MKPIASLCAALCLLAAPAFAEDREEAIPLDKVPEKVMQAAVLAVPGIVLESAEREVEKGAVVYELTGKADGKTYEVEVDESGKVLEVEEGDDDEDGDGNGDGDEDDGDLG